MSYVCIHDKVTKQKLKTFSDDTECAFPFSKLFNWATNDGRFAHVVSPIDIRRVLTHYRLPVTLTVYSRTLDRYVFLPVPLNRTLMHRFEEFVSFIYSLLNNGREIVIKSIYMSPACLVS